MLGRERLDQAPISGEVHHCWEPNDGQTVESLGGRGADEVESRGGPRVDAPVRSKLLETPSLLASAGSATGFHHHLDTPGSAARTDDERETIESPLLRRARLIVNDAGPPVRIALP